MVYDFLQDTKIEFIHLVINISLIPFFLSVDRVNFIITMRLLWVVPEYIDRKEVY